MSGSPRAIASSKHSGTSTRAYEDGAVTAATKELIGLALSVFSRCEECVAYHVQSARKRGVTAQEAMEAVKLAVLAGGSVTYPTARNAVELIDSELS